MRLALGGESIWEEGTWLAGARAGGWEDVGGGGDVLPFEFGEVSLLPVDDIVGKMSSSVAADNWQHVIDDRTGRRSAAGALHPRALLVGWQMRIDGSRHYITHITHITRPRQANGFATPSSEAPDDKEVGPSVQKWPRARSLAALRQRIRTPARRKRRR